MVDSTIERVIRIGRKLYGERFDEQHITSLGFGGAGVVYLIHYTENPDIIEISSNNLVKV